MTWVLICLTQGVKLLPGEVWQVSKRYSQYYRSYLRKTTGGPFAPPPSGARVKLGFARFQIIGGLFQPIDEIVASEM